MAFQASLNGHRGAEAQARVQRMVGAAQQLFIAHGYHRTTLDAILKVSGGSKATLRKYFGNKAGLLGEVLADEAARCVARAGRALRLRTVEAALGSFSRVVLDFYCRTDALLIYRAVIAQAAEEREVGRRFHADGHMTFVTALAEFLAFWEERGALKLINPLADSDRFLHMLRSGPHDQALLGVKEPATREAIREQVDACVRIFLGGLRA